VLLTSMLRCLSSGALNLHRGSFRCHCRGSNCNEAGLPYTLYDLHSVSNQGKSRSSTKSSVFFPPQLVFRLLASIMETSSPQLQRAKRRYSALLRERATLATSGKSDPLTEDEITKLEAEYPELIPANTEHEESSNKCRASPPLPTGEAVTKTRTNDSVAGPNSRSQFPAMHPSSQSRLRKAAPPSLFIQTPPQSSPLRCSLSADAPLRLSEDPQAKQAFTNKCFMMMFALQLFNERRQKSMMTRCSIVTIALLSLAAAVAHCIVVDPMSILGSLLSPSLLTLLVHANALCGVYMRRKRRFTAPMVVVYTIFDVFPSLGLGIVCYNLGLIVLGSYGFRRLSFAC
jgi:hypothetical protein